jgi:peptide/nickel transport system permease protein
MSSVAGTAPAPARRLWSRRHSPIGPSGAIGFLILVLVIGLSVVGPYIAPYSPTEIATGLPAEGASGDHWLGTDTLGRDVFSRVLNGGRSLIVLSLATTLLAFAVGATLGLVSGYKGRLADHVVTRTADILMSMPPLVLVMVVVLILGTSSLVLAAIVSAFFAPRIARTVRGMTQAVCTNDYVVAAFARGESTRSIISNEILPNIHGPLIGELTVRLSQIIVFIAALNFLGFGVQPPTADWGLMVSENRVILTEAPLASLAPAAAIALLCIGTNLVAEDLIARRGVRGRLQGIL